MASPHSTTNPCGTAASPTLPEQVPERTLGPLLALQEMAGDPLDDLQKPSANTGGLDRGGVKKPCK